MKKIIATRMYDFGYFHDFFVEYYVKQGYDHILVFCKLEHRQQLERLLHQKVVEIFELPEHNVPYLYDEEKVICNWIYQKTLDFYESNFSKNDAIVLFADDDEFYPTLQPNSLITRVTFYEWYLHSSISDNLSASEFHDLVLSNKCMGQLLSIWNDPYYKESIIKINADKLNDLRQFVYSNAFHRITKGGKLIEIKKDHIYANHLKGIPLSLAKERIENSFKAIQIEDDWCSNHYTIEFRNLCLNYDEFYKGLKNKENLVAYVQERLVAFMKEDSFYETRVLPSFCNPETSTAPSKFFKNKLL